MSNAGICALCGLHRELCESHLLLPKFVYKRLRQADAQNPNPVSISAAGLIQTSDQYTRSLLCSECENDRFNARGEQWVAKYCLQDNNVTFPLLDVLQNGATHQIFDEESAVFYTSAVSQLDQGALEYFAASMVWRGQYVVRNGRNAYSLMQHDKAFRAYLLGHSTFPVNASLCIFIRYRSNMTQMSHGTYPRYTGTANSYTFAIPGLTFQILVGQHRDFRIRSSSFNENGLRPILDMNAVDETHNDNLTRVLDIARGRGRRTRLRPPAA